MTLPSYAPPRWAEYVLKLVLRPQDQETLPGDLLEEYRDNEERLGRARAQLRYAADVLSIAFVEARRPITTAHALIVGWLILFFVMLALPGGSSPSRTNSAQFDLNTFQAIATVLLTTIISGLVLVSAWFWFVIRARRRTLRGRRL
jgi:hypothetical protein